MTLTEALDLEAQMKRDEWEDVGLKWDGRAWKVEGRTDDSELLQTFRSRDQYDDALRG